MDPAALAKLQQQARIGGKGTPRRKTKKPATKPAVKEDTKLSGFYRNLKFRPVPGIEHVNMFSTTGKVRHFASPQVTASAVSNNVFSITGHSEEKDASQVPSAIKDLEADYLELLQRMKSYKDANPEAFAKAAENAQKGEEVPELVEALTGRCDQTIVRREIRDLSKEEWDTFAEVLTTLQKDGALERMSRVHRDNYHFLHGYTEFFSWHRRAIIDFEHQMRAINPNITMPYWDASRDFYDPASSVVLSGKYLGSNGGVNKTGGCVTDGVQANWHFEFPTPHCFTHTWDNGQYIKPWHSPEFIASVLQITDDLNSFREIIEMTLHREVHVGMGGDMPEDWSPTDLGFYVHHANIDRLWATWQSMRESRIEDYTGRSYHGDETTIEDRLTHYQDPVHNIIRLGSGISCYQYDTIGNPEHGIPNGHFAPEDLREYSAHPMSNHPLLKLPKSILDKWFPHGLDLNWMQSVLPPIPGKWKQLYTEHGENNGAILPYPPIITKESIEENHLNETMIRRVEQLSYEFIDDLNSAGYRTPYDKSGLYAWEYLAP
ncbi:hypothetical protein H4219_000514 [Mycoemilia scoparia]|uniref:Nascent polypeptide-associated complex subunit beta n=1 Tax=Mycoemilia scoparia TaxID=417184 RepID=A0A9W8ABZ6_9FUNG|nr:hypothetical protein H4219_000514 [Mycoemilia scoparia]